MVEMGPRASGMRAKFSAIINLCSQPWFFSLTEDILIDKAATIYDVISMR